MRRLTFSLVVFILAAPVHAADPEQVPLFVAGEGGYHTYRIPALIVSKKGTLLAFCEGRKDSRSDTGNIDLLLKRSFDHGKTWSKTQVVWDDADNTCGNPCPVIDARTGAIVLLLTHNLGSDTQRMIEDRTAKGTRTVWVARSEDDGESWSKPTDITKDVKKADWTWYATGPGIGIQLKSGRLVVPCDHYRAGTKAQYSHVIYSDDIGKTWKLGGIVGPKCNEAQVVELDDGSVMLNIRSYRGTNRRLVALSKDGGETFGDLVEDRTLIEPVCQASIMRLPGKKGGILFANPASTKRENMTVRLSRDEGKTWAHARTLHPGPAAYSCLAALGDGNIGCLYERGQKNAYETITFARFSTNWLTEAPTMNYIDAHVHVWTPDTARYPLAPGYKEENMQPPSFTPEELFKHCKPAGVGRIALIQISFYGFDNSYMLDAIAKHPDVFVGTAVINPLGKDPGREMDELAKRGVRAFRIHPKLSEQPIDKWLRPEGYEKMFAAGARNNQALACLIGPDALPELERMCREYPATPVIIDHLCRIGADGVIRAEDVERLCAMAKHKKVMVKVGAFYALGKKKAPYADVGPMIKKVVAAFGANRCMWESDCPFQVQGEHTYQASVDLVRRHLDFLSADDKDWLLRKTAESFFFAK